MHCELFLRTAGILFFKHFEKLVGILEFFSPPKKNVVSFTGAPSQPPNNDFFQISDFVQDESVAAAQQCMKIAPTMQAPPSTQVPAQRFTLRHA